MRRRWFCPSSAWKGLVGSNPTPSAVNSGGSKRDARGSGPRKIAGRECEGGGVCREPRHLEEQALEVGRATALRCLVTPDGRELRRSRGLVFHGHVSNTAARPSSH